MARITYKGRPFNTKTLMNDIEKQGIELGMQAIEAKARGAASSIIDPETGTHADVFVDRQPGNGVALRTKGSPAFARLLEKRLGVDAGEVESIEVAAGVSAPKVYLAHATEDKPMVRPVAEYLMAHGVEVWFDEWDIEAGDSLRQKMEGGLGWMTHFVVILTPVSITKPWVAREIDVGFTRLVGGRSRMVPLRVGVEIGELSEFLQTLLCPTFDPASAKDLKGLLDRLHGVSRKPALGPAPQYARTAPDGLSGWSPAAIAVGRYIVQSSVNATVGELVVTLDALTETLNIATDDLRIAVLDLQDAGYLRELNARGHFLPEPALFVDFDEAFMPFSPSADARTLANRMVVGEDRAVDTKLLAEELGWEPRRINSAICYLERAGAIHTRHALASAPWRSVQLVRSDQTLRFARRHG